ncbi:hypothetical protein HanRHA438_Chr16g0748611 [Helianthus annuus]|nr:hypothetical protein HanRHA438_Chr16g0748611 [Helianthus annuus]
MKIVNKHVFINVDSLNEFVIHPSKMTEISYVYKQRFAGYLNNLEATTSTLDSTGWLTIGDLCHIDEDGLPFVCAFV